MRVQKTNEPTDEQLFDGPANHPARVEIHHELGPWFHNLHLPSGGQTAPGHPLGDYPANAWAQIRPALPDDLRGWEVLNIGCNAGYFCLELAQLGARVLGCDRDPHCVRQAQWAAEQFGLGQQLQFRQMHVYEVARAAQRYDLVLFMGGFYQLRYPALALDIMAERCDQMLIIQPFASLDPVHPKGLGGLDTAALAELGFEVLDTAEESIHICHRLGSDGASAPASPSRRADEIAAAVGPRYLHIERPIASPRDTRISLPSPRSSGPTKH